jgi:hypothetical protein
MYPLKRNLSAHKQNAKLAEMLNFEKKSLFWLENNVFHPDGAKSKILLHINFNLISLQ